MAAAALAAEARAEDVIARARAERLAATGHCDQALKILDELAAREPGDARLVYQLGECQLQLDRYEDAALSFRRARALDPALPDIDLQIAMASFHANDLEGTLTAVADARRAGSQRPELDLYEGLALFGLARDDAAAARTLEGAGSAGNRALDPIASYYAGIAWRRAGDPDRARAALERVVANYPGTEWAVAAQRALEGAMAATVTPRMWARVRAGMEWDSNVVFRGTGVTLPSDISGQSDFLGVWTGEFGAELYRSGPWALGARADYIGTAHFQLHDFDLEYPGVGFWVDRTLPDASLFRIDYAVHYGWLGYHAYVTSNQLTPQWFKDFGRYGQLHVFGQVLYDDFHSHVDGEIDGPAPGHPMVGAPCGDGVTRCGPPGLDEQKERNRDGYGGAIGFDHTVPVAFLRGAVWGGAFWEIYESQGTEYQYQGYGVRAGFRSELPAQLTLFVWGGYTYRPYRHPSTYPAPDNPDLLAGLEYALSPNDRQDNFYEVEVELQRPITDSLSASVRYAYQRNVSNVAVYDYDRSVVGAYLTWVWSR